jgi:hypothetical protein
MTDDVREIVRRPRRCLPEIKIPGDKLVPRFDFAHDTIGVCERTAMRMNLPTVYVGGIAYVKQEASLKILADKATRRNQPRKRRRA